MTARSVRSSRQMPRDAALVVPHQRAAGALELRFAAGPGRRAARLRHLFQAAPLRALFPRPEPDDPPLAAVVNTAGGLAGGDALRIAVEAGEGTAATVTTPAAEKVYRSLGPEAAVEAELHVGAGSTLEWIPQGTILFDGARLRRRHAAHLDGEARLLAAETLVFGRAAHGERLRTGWLHDAWRLHRGGALVWADAMRLEGDIAAHMSGRFAFGGAQALGTVVLAAPDAEAHLPLLRGLASAGPAAGGATAPRTGVVLARWTGGAQGVRAQVEGAVVALRAAALGLPPRPPRLWTT